MLVALSFAIVGAVLILTGRNRGDHPVGAPVRQNPFLFWLGILCLVAAVLVVPIRSAYTAVSSTTPKDRSWLVFEAKLFSSCAMLSLALIVIQRKRLTTSALVQCLLVAGAFIVLAFLFFFRALNASM